MKSKRTSDPRIHHQSGNKPNSLIRIDARAFDRELGPVKLYPGESRQAFNAMRNKVFLAAIPEDAIEELFCRDISMWVWEIQRYQRIKAATIKASIVKIIRDMLINERDDRPDELYAQLPELKDCEDQIPPAIAEFLEEKHKSFDEIVSEAHFKNISAIRTCDDKIEKLQGQIEKLLSDIDRRRDAFKRRLEVAARSVDPPYRPIEVDYVPHDDAQLNDVNAAEAMTKTKRQRRVSSAAPEGGTLEPVLPGLEDIP